MININGKEWNKLKLKDIEKFCYMLKMMKHFLLNLRTKI